MGTELLLVCWYVEVGRPTAMTKSEKTYVAVAVGARRSIVGPDAIIVGFHGRLKGEWSAGMATIGRRKGPHTLVGMNAPLFLSRAHPRHITSVRNHQQTILSVPNTH